MKRRVAVILSLTLVIIFIPVGNDVSVNVDVKFKHPPKAQTKATMEQKKANKATAMEYARVGWGWDKTQRRCINSIFIKESRYDNLAKNQQGSSAFGIAQMLGEKSKDPAVQILRAYRYIAHRYGTPCKAWAHHSKGWY